MMAEKKRQSLGRGLSSLLGEEPKAQAVQNTIRGSRQVPVESLIPGRYQPRHFMDEEKIEELAQSVRENGIIQPLLVRPHPEQENAFEIIREAVPKKSVCREKFIRYACLFPAVSTRKRIGFILDEIGARSPGLRALRNSINPEWFFDAGKSAHFYGFLDLFHGRQPGNNYNLNSVQ